MRHITTLNPVCFALLLVGLMLCAARATAQAANLPSMLDVPVTQVATGSDHTCALTTAGGVRCWGSNQFGQLGDNSTTDRHRSVGVTGLASGVVAIAAGSNHTCALTTVGGVKCWGNNDYGQLGDASTTSNDTPVDVTGLTNGVVAIAAGSNHTCALTTTGAVKCWGYNGAGQLGDNSTTSRYTPVDVTGLASGVLSIAAGIYHTCALTTTGGMKCWGYNQFGELGDNSTIDRYTPVDVIGLASDVVAIAAGGYHSCALTAAGGVKCWGYNVYGELGDNSATDSHAPVDVAGLASDVVAIAAGGYHSCALTTAGGVKCWGYNVYGELGDNSTTNSYTPVDATGLASGVVAIAAGGYHSCALTTTGGVKCWGDNAYGQLGVNNIIDRYTPWDVAGLAGGVPTITAGAYHTCALTTTLGVKCWGYNYYGQLGDNSTTTRLVPVDVPGLLGGSGIVAITAGYEHTCALATTIGVGCWGNNAFGQLGDSTTTDRTTPVGVTGLASGVMAITAGAIHTCALTTAGGVKCWGNNQFGQLGDNSNTSTAIPVDVTGLASGVVAIAAGSFHTCVLTTTGGVKCWGRNVEGQLGDNSTTDSTTPVDVTGLASGIVAIATHHMHTCALTTTGSVKCWGDNAYGELGDNSTTQRDTPVDVTGLASGVVAIAAGDYHSCALTTTGGMECWGDNADGQLGDNSTMDHHAPVDVTGLASGVVTIAAGDFYSCALTTASGLKCWGDNSGGQLGNNSYTDQHVPVNILAGQTLAFTPPATLSPGGNVALNATASGGGSVAIVYDTWTPDTCIVSGTTLAITGAAGSLCGVRASRAGGSDGVGGTTANAPQQLRLIQIAEPGPTLDALTVSVDDHRDYVQYGKSFSYEINVLNTSDVAIGNVQVDDAAPLRLLGISWTCVSDACAGMQGGGFVHALIPSLAAHASITIIFDTYVNSATCQCTDLITDTVTVTVNGNTKLATDSTQAVIFRDAFEQGGDGAQITEWVSGSPKSVAMLDTQNTHTLDLDEAWTSDGHIVPVASLRASNGDALAVQALHVDRKLLVRIAGNSDGKVRFTSWAAMPSGATQLGAGVARDGSGQLWLLLVGAQQELQMPLAATSTRLTVRAKQAKQ